MRRDFTFSMRMLLLAVCSATAMLSFGQRTLPKAPVTSITSGNVTVKAGGNPVPFVGKNDSRLRAPLTSQQKLELKGEIVRAMEGCATVPKARKQRRANGKEAWKTLLSESFDKMTAGTQDVPDKSQISDEDWNIPASYLDNPGFTGEGIFQAGGAVALAYPGFGGVLNTPQGKYKGKVKLSFRVKSIARRRQIVSISLVRNGIEDPLPASDEYEFVNFYTVDGWTDYEFVATNKYNDEDVFFQINAGTYDNGIIIDDLKIEQDENYVAVPKNVSTSSYTHDGFKAAWGKVNDAQSYLVNLYRTEPKAGAATSMETGFDDVAVGADGKFVNLPEGWTSDLKKDSVGTGYDGNAIIIAGDPIEGAPGSISTNGTGGRINSFSFYMTKLSENSDMFVQYGYKLGYAIAGFSPKTNEWENIVRGDVPEGSYKFTSEALKEAGYDIAGLYTKLRISGGINDEGSFAIDNFAMETDAAVDTVAVSENLPAADENYAFAGLDMSNYEYFFNVRAVRDANHVSEPTELTHAFGVAAPVATEATDIDERGEFTANWNVEPKVNLGYGVALNKTFVAPDVVDDYEMLSEDFSLVTTEATVDNGQSYGNSSKMTSLDGATHESGWYGMGNVVANGMLGCLQADEDKNYEVITPELPLNNGDGSYKVSATVYFVAADTLVIQGGDKRCLAVIGKKGQTAEANAVFTNGDEATRVWFYTEHGGSFFLDNVKVTQTLKKGDKLRKNNIELVETEDNHYTFSGLDAMPGTSYSYQVYSLRELWGETAMSEPSNEVNVNLSTTGIRAIDNTEASSAGARYYDLSGRCLPSLSGAKGIFIIKKDGKAVKVVR